MGCACWGPRGRRGPLPWAGCWPDLAGFGRVLAGASLPFRPEWWYWNASRVMANGEINEFPFFTFLYADLHAHLIALPLTLLALAMSVGLVVRPAGRADGDAPG